MAVRRVHGQPPPADGRRAAQRRAAQRGEHDQRSYSTVSLISSRRRVRPLAGRSGSSQLECAALADTSLRR